MAGAAIGADTAAGGTWTGIISMAAGMAAVAGIAAAGGTVVVAGTTDNLSLQKHSFHIGAAVIRPPLLVLHITVEL